MNNAPPPGPDGWGDLLAFIAVLATGISLIVFGHVTVVGLPMACTALVGLFAAWRRRGGWWDLLAFIAVLATGISLIVFGHVTVVGLPMACTALVGLFAAWRRRGGR